MKNRGREWRAGGVVALAALWAASSALGASHREALLMTLDPGADISDVHAFVSYDAANLARSPEDRRVTLIMNVVPGQCTPGSAPRPSRSIWARSSTP